jgi:hypothetical protein
MTAATSTAPHAERDVRGVARLLIAAACVRRAPGMQMSVRLSFKRTGEIIGSPRVTYTSPNTPPEVKELYYQAIIAALERCSPMPFTTGLGGAVAGRPIAIRFVDNRE